MWFKKRPIETETEEERTVRDPVCGMDLARGKTDETLEYAGETFYFCSASCAAKFTDAPESYARFGDHPFEHG